MSIQGNAGQNAEQTAIGITSAHPNELYAAQTYTKMSSDGENKNKKIQ